MASGQTTKSSTTEIKTADVKKTQKFKQLGGKSFVKMTVVRFVTPV